MQSKNFMLCKFKTLQTILQCLHLILFSIWRKCVIGFAHYQIYLRVVQVIVAYFSAQKHMDEFCTHLILFSMLHKFFVIMLTRQKPRHMSVYLL